MKERGRERERETDRQKDNNKKEGVVDAVHNTVASLQGQGCGPPQDPAPVGVYP